MDAMRSKSLRQVLHFYKYDGTWLADTPKPALKDREPGFTLSRTHAHDVSSLYETQITHLQASVFTGMPKSLKYQ